MFGDSCASLAGADVSIGKLVAGGSTNGISGLNNILVEKTNEANSAFDLTVDDDGEITIVAGRGE